MLLLLPLLLSLRPSSCQPHLPPDPPPSSFFLPRANKDFVLPQSYQLANFNPSTSSRPGPPPLPPPPSYQPKPVGHSPSSQKLPPADPASVELTKRQGEVTEWAVANASNQLGFDLYPYATSGKQNALYSPISLSAALAMLYLGTNGNTAKEMDRTLNYHKFGIDQNNLHSGVRSLMSRLTSDPSFTLDMVNLLLVQKGFAIGKEYQDTVLKYYQAALQNVDFEQEGEVALNRLNEFVAHRTRNKISQALSSPLEPSTKAFLMNVIYFKGQWQTRFDQRFTRPSTFYNKGEIPRTVAMMNMKSRFPFTVVSSADTFALELPYEGGRVSMLLLLPKPRLGLDRLERRFLADPQGFLDKLDFQDVMVDLSLPRFSLAGDFEAKSALQSLGMRSAFSPSHADLGGINPDLYVTRVVHNAVMEVNEEGSEASAFSGIATGIRIGGPPAPLFTVDHPFLFLIRDKATGAVLFMGKVTEL